MTEPPFQPIYRGPITKTEDKKDIQQLIQTEWNIINKLQHLAENSRYDKYKGFYYQTLASHIRTLSILLKLHGQPDQTQDLAILLSQIQTQAKTLAKRLKNQCKTH
jgi:5-bromo-4-chloroindolyl phosphate hydrolysis protein